MYIRVHTLTYVGTQIHGERGECSQESKRRGRRCTRETSTRVAWPDEGEKRIETLGFSLETDDACGSLRVRDYERQLEIRSKQMDCENTSSLSLSISTPPLSTFLSTFLSSLPTLAISPEGGCKRLGLPQIFLYLYRTRGVVPS